jgi:hypothetical protein
MVGVHVRMVAEVSKDTPGLDEDEALRMELATAFRVSCHYHHFEEMMLTFPKTTRFFLSADSPEAYKALLGNPGLLGRVFFVDSNECTERSASCMLYAAADLILLSRTAKLLTSKWSAFSETAGRISGVDTIDGCEEPEGGWKLGDSRLLAKQILRYLQDKNFPDLERVSRALRRFSG